MSINKKEIAKFFAGVTAWEAVVHLSMAGCDLLPIRWCGFTITHTINNLQIILPGLISILLTWYGWFSRESVT